MPKKNYCYTWIRTDLPIEQQIVQAAHSALEAGREFQKPDAISHLILLEAESEHHLRKIGDELTELGIKYHTFFEPDHNRGYTSLTTEPITSKAIRKHLRRHTLYKYCPTSAYGCKDETHMESKNEENK